MEWLVDVSNVVDEASELVGTVLVLRWVSELVRELSDGGGDVLVVFFDILVEVSHEVWVVNEMPWGLDVGVVSLGQMFESVVFEFVGEGSSLNEGMLILISGREERKEVVGLGKNIGVEFLKLIISNSCCDHVPVIPPCGGGAEKCSDC